MDEIWYFIVCYYDLDAMNRWSLSILELTRSKYEYVKGSINLKISVYISDLFSDQCIAFWMLILKYLS